MVKRKQFKVVFLAIGILLNYAMSCSGASPKAYENTLIEYLEMGPATHLDINTHGKSSQEIDKRLIEMYHGNGLQLFWIEDGKPSKRAVDILTVLTNAGNHGLDPASYFITNIQKFWKNSEPASLVQLDILLSLGMMRYVADQREGRVKPQEIDSKLFASASDVTVDWEMLKKEAFQGKDIKTFLEQQVPPFSQYKLLQKWLAEYRMIAAVGGWPTIPNGEVLKPGMTDKRIPYIRKRLAVTGELGAGNMHSAAFDAELVKAVKKFQQRHNLVQDGVIGKQTLAIMNVQVTQRIQQIIANMERYRWLKRLKDDRLVAVNIAAFEASAGIPGKFDITMPVIVGKTYHETPVFNDTIKYVVFNPYWNLTPSIARNETLPKLKKDPHYLKKQNMEIFDGWEPGAKELDATAIDWSRVSKKQMNRYHLRQKPGPNNALGTLKLVFPNKYNVYLHDTPAHQLFKREQRAFSHGCIRMDRPAEMAAWVLGGEEMGWTVERVNEIVASRKRQVVNLKTPLPVYILYRTAQASNTEDALYFYEDIYGRDRLLIEALAGKKG